MVEKRRFSSVACVIVTYGARANFCLNVVESALAAGASKIILIDNGSTEESHIRLKNYATERAEIKFIRHQKNLGSAGGFAAGLKHALATQTENIWLLDDDNVPDRNSLATLFSARLAISSSFPDAVLYCYRGDTRTPDLRAVRHGKIKKYPQDAFLGFTFSQSLAEKLFQKKYVESVNFPIVRVSYGPYGGMFARRETLERVALPREDFFLYADDHEYTERLSKIGVDQFLIYPAKVNDIDVSASVSAKGIFDPRRNDFRVFYEVRNHTYLGMGRIRSIWRYRFNKFVFLAWHSMRAIREFIMHPRIQTMRFKLVMAAIKDGERGCLGVRQGLSIDIGEAS